MSIWHKEVIKVNGSYKVYVEIQNDYTGGITSGIREIKGNTGSRYFTADGNRFNIEQDIIKFKSHEENVNRGLKLLKDSPWMR